MLPTLAKIKLGVEKALSLGNLDSARDWGFAGDYVEAMWRMLQQDSARDYVVGTGQAHTVRRLVELAFGHAGLDWQEHVVQDKALLRPAEVAHLIADPSKALAELGWQPRTTFEDLIRMMVDSDLKLVSRRIAAGDRL